MKPETSVNLGTPSVDPADTAFTTTLTRAQIKTNRLSLNKKVNLCVAELGCGYHTNGSELLCKLSCNEGGETLLTKKRSRQAT